MAFGERLPKNPYKSYYEAHWGKHPNRVWTVDDPYLPPTLVEMGKLLEIRLKGGSRIEFGPGNQLCFTTDAANRLYNVLTKKAMGDMLDALWDPNGEALPLREVAKIAGGRQSRYPYAPVLVQPVGHMTHNVYQTDKQSYSPEDPPDGMSEYIHKYGEHNEGTGELPIVCVDMHGRLWYAGGAYKVLRGGITG